MLQDAALCAMFDAMPHDVQDLPGALDDGAVAEGLNLACHQEQGLGHLQTSAIKGEGLLEGLDWLSNQLKTRKR